MKKIDDQTLTDIKLKRKERVLPLLFVNSKINIDGKEIAIDPLLLFQRICIIIKRDEEIKKYLSF